MNEKIMQNGTAPDERLSDFCCMSTKTMNILEDFARTNGYDADNMVEKLDEDYAAAYGAGTVVATEAKITFPTRFEKKDGTCVEVILRPNSYEGKEWFLCYVTTNSYEVSKTTAPGKQLEAFAYLGSWAVFLADLAAKAIAEEWDFAGTDDGAFEKKNRILAQYIKYTFSRLSYENKICINDDESFSAFNTGLVDDYYNDIYACFAPNPVICDLKWRFVGFCTAGSGSLGKQLVNNFNPLPEPASYFSHKEDLLFDSQKPLHIDFAHIILDNANRLPLQFLHDQFFDNMEARDLVEQIRTTSDTTDGYEKLRTMLTENNKLYLRVQNRLKDAIELARKRARWNYRTAVPLYYPKHNTMSLMLPLALIDDFTPDIALVVGLTHSGCYQGQTVLTMSQAYVDARLVCKITENWLDPTNISICVRKTDAADDEEA